MIERLYRCDLCRVAHDADSGNLFGLWWSGTGLYVKQSIREFEHHICRSCYAAIKSSDIPLGIEQPEAAE